MDDVLNKAGSQVVSFAIKSSISIATSYALKTISTYVTKLPASEKKAENSSLKQIEQLKVKLESRLNIVSYAIELIRLAASKGHTNLNSIIELTNDLKDDLDNIDEVLSQFQNDNAIPEIIKYIESIIARIDEVTPFINLSIATSGISIDSTLPKHISTNYLVVASNWILESDKVGKDSVQVGESFEICLHSIFYTNKKVIWKEDITKAQAKIMKIHDEKIKYKYQLSIEQDLDDDRYHDEDEEAKVLLFDLEQIIRVFFSVCGDLLKLKDNDSPVLVLKIAKEGGDAVEWYGLAGDKIKLLEYLLRLCFLQSKENEPLNEISDEIYAIYLSDENPNSIKNVEVNEVATQLEQIKLE